MAEHLQPTIRGWSENLPVKMHHEVYYLIDPTSAYGSQSLKGKVVFITGASRGIGRIAGITFAKAGAAVAISARSERALNETKELILKETPDANVQVYVVDVTKTAEMEAAVEGAVEAFGRLDIMIANAGAANSFDKPMHERAADEWWHGFEGNVLGVYNALRSSAKHLRATKGYFIGAQIRWPGGSDYQTSKHAVNRLVEFIAQENRDIMTFSVHPGEVVTELALAGGLQNQGAVFPDPPELAA